ncbi:MAG: hypothetical protein PHI97_13635 [Desulfobulbus sp.]|nr:hypothetical protein [Desulfobulbus sp.]
MKKRWYLAVLFFTSFSSGTGFAFDKVFFQGYYGQVADMSLQNVFQEPGRITDIKDAKMITLGCGGENLYWDDRFSVGGEVNASLHWGYEEQEFGEFSAAVFLRWYKFPWAWKFPNSITIGDGLSFVTDYPEYEIDFGGNRNDPMREKWLNFLFIEVAFSVTEGTDIFVRLHHRCTAWGLIGSPDGGGVTFPSIGLRYSF